MHRSRWRRIPIVLALALLPLTGCETSSVTIELPTFGKGDVDGIWMWKLSSTSGQYERSCRITLSNAKSTPSGETIAYEQDCVSGHPGLKMQAFIQRKPGDLSTATIQLYYFRWSDEAGSYKASAYNAAGESALSSTTLTL